jgi:uncharacterized protein YdaU (DUF1376 family)
MSEKKTDAWMPLWIGAYLADTQHLTTQEHGAYFLLMMAYWRNKGPLPDDDKRLASIVKATPKEWKVLRVALSEFFLISDGVWLQKRIEAELNGSKERSLKAASRAKAGAQARWNDEKSDASSMLQASVKHASSMPQALLEYVHNGCLSDALHNTSHTNGIGIPTLVAKDQCVGIPPHTLFSDEFKTAANARPDLDIALVWTNFNNHYPPEKRTVSRWSQWLKNERSPGGVQAVRPSVDAAELTRKERDRDMAGTKPPSDEVRKQLAELTKNLKKNATQGASV